MKIEQIFTGCLAQGAYYIESEGEVAIIDPLREVQPYLSKAQDAKAQIKYIFETHFHADFVSGHVTLAEKTGAPIVYGPHANPSFKAHIAQDGEEFKVGKLTIKALHTPGHTMESTTYLLIDAAGKNHAIFSGDTLFLGDVGRPDLAQKLANMTQEDLAGLLFESLRNKIMPLEDEVIVYPAHGAGSACGKNMMSVTVDTLGNQKKVNYALRADMSREEFIQEVTDGLQPPPGYFPLNVKLNKEGYESIDQIIKGGNRALSPQAFEAAAEETGALILDVRTRDEYVKGHIPRSIFIGLDGSFAPWVGSLIQDVEQPLLLVVNADKIEEAITRLARVGFDNTLGFLEGGIQSWGKAGKEIDTLDSVSPDEFASAYLSSDVQVLDVRKPGEYGSGHVQHSVHAPLSSLNAHLSSISRDKPVYVYCAGGYRSVIAASILKSRGIHNLVNIEKGYKGIGETNVPTVQSIKTID